MAMCAKGIKKKKCAIETGPAIKALAAQTTERITKTCNTTEMAAA